MQLNYIEKDNDFLKKSRIQRHWHGGILLSENEINILTFNNKKDRVDKKGERLLKMLAC